MKTAEYTTSILPDGHLAIPKEVKKKLDLTGTSKVKVIIAKEEEEKTGSTQGFLKLFGTWEDNRNANEIIDDIYETRQSSKRETEL